MQPIIVSFYTHNTGYEKEVENLISSLKTFHLPYEIEGINSLGSWEKNCCYKPQFLLEKLQKLQRPLLWVDADAVFLKKPRLFTSLSCDIALYILQNVPNDHPSKMISGTIYMNNTIKAQAVLNEWKQECETMLKSPQKTALWDQIALRNVLLRNQSNACIYALPKEYYTIYDKKLSKKEKEKTIILHYQASRLLKNSISGEVLPFWELLEIPPEEMRRLRDTFIKQI